MLVPAEKRGTWWGSSKVPEQTTLHGALPAIAVKEPDLAMDPYSKVGYTSAFGVQNPIWKSPNE